MPQDSIERFFLPDRFSEAALPVDEMRRRRFDRFHDFG